MSCDCIPALSLQHLNDGNGVNLRKGVQDLEVTFRDGSGPLQIEFGAQTKGATAATAVTTAANGIDAQIEFTSIGTGENYDGYRIKFVDDAQVLAGSETVEVNSTAKQLTIHIDAGNTRAYQVIEAVNNDNTAKQFFSAAAAAGGNASGIVTTNDTGTTSGGAPAFNDEKTVGDLLATLNAADPTRLQARLSASGDRIRARRSDGRHGRHVSSHQPVWRDGRRGPRLDGIRIRRCHQRPPASGRLGQRAAGQPGRRPWDRESRPT